MTARPIHAALLWRVCPLATLLAFAPAAVADETESQIAATLREANALREAGSYAKAAKRLRRLEKTELGAGGGLLRARLHLTDGNAAKAAEVAEASLLLRSARGAARASLRRPRSRAARAGRPLPLPDVLRRVVGVRVDL